MGQSCCKSEEPSTVTVIEPTSYPMQHFYPEYPPAPGSYPPGSYPYNPYPPGPFYPPQKPDVIVYIGDKEAYRWISRSGDRPMPEGAFKGGRDSDGSEIFVGRAFHEGDMVPAKIIPDKGVAFVSYAGEEHPKHEFEVLCQGEFAWEFCSNGSIPPDAVVGGQTSEGEPLYIGRVLHSGSQTVGKVQASHGCLYIPYNGEELSFTDYEVLVLH